ncbi:MAG: hypothetical protein ACLFO2_02845 [Candidatus Woesearchaeota archaeon]
MARKQKKHLTREEEFDILKLVLDKFLWIGVIIMVFGVYRLLTTVKVWENLFLLGVGVVIMLLFTWLLIREYNVMK